MAPSLAMDVSLRALAERSRSPPPRRRLPEAVPEEGEEPEEAAACEEPEEAAFEAAAGDRVLQVSPAPPPLAGWQVVDVWPAAAAGGGEASPPEDAMAEALAPGGLRRRLQAPQSPGAVVPQGPRAAVAAAAADLDGGIVHKVRRASKIAELLATEPNVIVGVVQDVAACAHLFGRESLAAWIVSFALLTGAFVVACLLWIRDGPHVL